ncbi:MAG: hypothetical protein HZC47_11190 [Methanobacterium sp.]|uniref:hypothetical protein n=1 Tax=Methanobacterium sp. TaxID=2164 RepID=UPI003D64C7CE|nr:hypothetical protein [Methanobacterium sp.]
MTETLILKITSEKGNIRVVSKFNGEVSVKIILLKLILGHCWWTDIPVVETIFKVIEDTIKNTIKEVYDYNDLTIDYEYRANDLLDDASKIEIFINSVTVDEVEIEVTGRYISFDGEDRRSLWKKTTSFRRKVQENVFKHL